MKENTQLSNKIKEITKEFNFAKYKVSISIINLKKADPEIFGINMEDFIYPASIYKVFIGAEILRKVDKKLLNLSDIVEIKYPNNVDKSIKSFYKKNLKNKESVLKAGEKITIDHLLYLMFNRSDNTASNTLIDIANREDINKNIILANNWNGSEVTRKFLGRKKEEEKYRMAKVTLSNTRHIAEFFYKIEKKQLINKWVSEKLIYYMSNWDKDGKNGLYIPEFINYYRKGGYFTTNLYRNNFFSAIKNIIKKGYAINKWSGDAGVVVGNNSHYVIAILTLVKTPWTWEKIPLTTLSRKIYNFIENL